MVDEAEAELERDFFLQLLDFFRVELDNRPGLHIDQVVMVLFGHFLVACAAIAEGMRLNDTGVFEQLDGPVDRRERDRAIERVGAPVQLLGVRVIFGARQNPRDDAPGLGHPQAFFDTEFF